MNRAIRSTLLFVLIVALCPASAGQDPKIKGAKLRLGSPVLRDQSGWANATLSPDATQFVVQSQRGTVKIDLATGESKGQFSEKSPVFGRLMKFSADGLRVISIGYSDVSVWDAASGKTLANIKRPVPFGEGSASLSADGKTVAVGGSQDFNAKDKPVTVVVWDVEKNAKLAEVPVVQNQTALVALSPDGKTLATWGTHFERNPPKDGVDPAADPNRIVQFWDASAGKELAKVRTEGYGSPIALFAPDGKTLALSAGNGVIRLLDSKTGGELRRIFGRSDQGSRLAFSPDGKTLATGGNDGTVQMWNATDGARIVSVPCPVGPLGFGLRGIMFTGNDRAVAWSAVGSAAIAWELPGGKLLTPLTGHVSGIRSIAFAPDTKEILTAGDDGQILRWGGEDGKNLGEVKLSQPGFNSTVRFPMTQVALTPDGKFAMNQFSLQGVYEVASGRQIASLQSALDSRSYICADGRTLLVAPSAPYPPKPMAAPAKIAVWDMMTGTKLAELEGPPSELVHATPTPDRSKIATVTLTRSDTKTEFHITSWDLKTGAKLGSHTEAGGFGNTYLAADNASVVASTPSGKLLIIRLADGKIVKELDTGRRNLTAHPAFSKDGKLLAAATSVGFGPGSSAEILLFDWESGKTAGKFRGHTAAATALMFSPDGATLASGSMDTTVILWNLADAEK